MGFDIAYVACVVSRVDDHGSGLDPVAADEPGRAHGCDHDVRFSDVRGQVNKLDLLPPSVLSDCSRGPAEHLPIE
jgi:hypothetical protein